MRLNAVIFGLGSHEAAWRMPESDPVAITRLDYWAGIARLAEDGGFDALFLGDVLAQQESADRHLSDALDPMMILAAIAGLTDRIGLIGTASTSFDHPYHLARRLASLDHLSNGRAGWNIVTSSNPLEAHNFGFDSLPDHSERYARAEDVVAAVKALWRTRETPPLADKAQGRYLDAATARPVDHSGPYVRSRGPLNVPRSPQGRPLLAQAGSSPAGRDFAARHADIVFTVQHAIEPAQAFYREMKDRARIAGRDPRELLVFPGFVPVVGETRQAAEDRLKEMGELTVHDHLLAKLSSFLGSDLSNADLDQALPPGLLSSGGNQSSRSRVEALGGISGDEGLTLRQLLLRFASGRGHLLSVGTGEDVAETMALWMEKEAADGFNVMCPTMPADLERFNALVMPELLRRGWRDERPPGRLPSRYWPEAAWT